MFVYHCANSDNAETILDGGFRDWTGYYMTDAEHTGVWVSDEPIEMASVPGTEVLRIEIPESEIAEFEWFGRGKLQREWLVPAELLNRYPVERDPSW